MLLSATAGWAEDGSIVTAPVPTELERIDAQAAADLAYELKVEASAVQLNVSSEADEALQAYVDQMAAVAMILDSEIRAGAAKSDSRELYHELRRIRLDVLELARSGKVVLPPGGAETFETLMNELGRYFEDHGAAALESQAVTD